MAVNARQGSSKDARRASKVGKPPVQRLSLRQSQGTNLQSVMESHNSIFDQMDRLKELSPGLSQPNLSQNMHPNASHLAKHGVSPSAAEDSQQFRTLREILDGIDEQENELLRTHSIAQQARSRETLKPLIQQNSSSVFGKVKPASIQRVHYEKFTLKDAKRTPNLRETHDSENTKAHGFKDYQSAWTVGAHLKGLSQQTEGVLSRSRQDYQSAPNNPIYNTIVTNNQDEPVLASEGEPNQDIIRTGISAEGPSDPKKVYPTTPQGIVKRVMPDKRKQQEKSPESALFLGNLARSLDPEAALKPDNQSSLIKDAFANFAVVQTHREPAVIQSKEQLISERAGTNVRTLDPSQMSLNIKSTFRQQGEPALGEEAPPNCYLLLPWADINLIVASIHDDSDQMKVYFGCKALKSILMVSPLEVTQQIVMRYAQRLLKRLVVVLSYEHLQEAMTEALHVLVLFTNLMEYDLISELVVCGLVRELNKFIDPKFLQTRVQKVAAELALQIMANVTQISNLSVHHAQKAYEPELAKDEEPSTELGLNFIDRMVIFSSAKQIRVYQGSQQDTIQSPAHSSAPKILEVDGVADQDVILASVPSHPFLSQSVQVGPREMADLRLQLAYVAKHLATRVGEIDQQNRAKLVNLLCELLVHNEELPDTVTDSSQSFKPRQSDSQQQPSLDPVASKQKDSKKHLLVWKQVISSLRMLCGGLGEEACTILNKNPLRVVFARSLMSILEFCCASLGQDSSNHYSLLMDTLITIGDLTASQSFDESSLFVSNDLFKVISQLLTQAAIERPFQAQQRPSTTTFAKAAASLSNTSSASIDLDKLDPDVIAKTQLQETIMWTVSNAVADDPACQRALLTKNEQLIDLCLKLVEVGSEKIDLEICYLLENILLYDESKPFIMARKAQSEQTPEIMRRRLSAASRTNESEGSSLRLGSSRKGQRRLSSKPDEPLFPRLHQFLTTLAKIIEARKHSKPGEDDSIEFQAVKILRLLFKMSRRKTQALVIGESSRASSVGMPKLIEGVYKLEHHWSERVYNRAIGLSSKYLCSGRVAPKLHQLTEAYSEFCQDSLFEPEKKVVEKKMAKISAMTKAKRSLNKRASEDSINLIEDENSEEEAARDRAVTFLMSAAAKRAYELKKKQEKEFNQRFKTFFVTVVRKYLVSEAPSMRVIDMSILNGLSTKGLGLKASRASVRKPMSKSKSKGRMINVESVDLDKAAPEEEPVIPRTLIAYSKLMEIRNKRIKELQAKQQAEQEKLARQDSQQMKRESSNRLQGGSGALQLTKGMQSGDLSVAVDADLLSLVSPKDGGTQDSQGFGKAKRKSSISRISNKKRSPSSALLKQASSAGKSKSKGRFSKNTNTSKMSQASSRIGSQRKDSSLRMPLKPLK